MRNRNQLIFFRKYPDFCKIWIGSLLASMADRMFITIIPIWLYNITHSSLWVATGTMAEMIAMILFGFVGGVFIDRIPKKQLISWVNLVVGILFMILALTSHLSLYTLIIIAFVFIISGCSRILATTRAVIVNVQVSKADLFQANSLMGMVFSTSLMVGPILAGLGLAVGNYIVIFVFNMICYLIYAFIGFSLKIDSISKHKRNNCSFMNEFRDGLKLILKHQVLWGNVLVLVFFMISVGIFSSMTYLFVKTILDYGSSVYVWSITIQGAGNILGNFFINQISRRFTPQWVVGVSLLLMTGFQLSYLLSMSVHWMLIVSPLIGGCQQIAMVTTGTIFQKYCPQEFLGRAVGVRMTVTSLLSASSVGIGVYFLQFISIRELLIGSSLLLVGSAICGYLFVRDKNFIEASEGGVK